jgi:type I restriction enzyme M protein
MKNLQEQLQAAMDSCRGSMEVVHLIELFTHVAFIAKEAPELFQVIVNTGQAKQLGALTEAGKSLENKYPTEVCAAPDQYRVDTKVISVAIELVSKVEDFNLLAQLLREFNKNTGRINGEMSSNLNMERVFTALIGDCSGQSLYDGACGLARISSKLNANKMYLEEKNQNTWVTAYRLLTLEGLSFELNLTDSLTSSTYGMEDRFDLAVMEPPFSLRFGADERRMLAESPFIEVPTGNVVSANSGDSLWIQQALSKLNDTGKGYILLPQGFLFRGGYDAKVRAYLLENELLEAVIGLPASILDGTAIAPALLILNKNKPAGSPIKFVDASEIGMFEKSQVEISEDDSQLIASLALGKLADDERYKEVFIPEIRKQNNELNISKYIMKDIDVEELDVNEELKKLSSYQASFEQSQQTLTSLLSKFRHD